MVSNYRLEIALGFFMVVLTFMTLVFDLMGKFIPFIIGCIPQIGMMSITMWLIARRKLLFHAINLPYIIWLLYVSAALIHGIFMSHNYWHIKNLVVNSLALSLPLFAILFTHPTTVINSIGYWMRLSVPTFVLLFVWITKSGYGHLVMGPAYFLIGVFFFWLPGKWKFCIGLLLLLLVTRSLLDRSQVLKGLLTIGMSCVIYYRKYISLYAIRFVHWLCYFIAITFLILGLSGIFNVFNPTDSFQVSIGKYMINNEDATFSEEDQLGQDTRTFLYMEIILSALNHEYVLFGRSPARGHDTEFPTFVEVAEEMDPNYIERIQDEFSIPSIFTWLGVVGVILYSILFIQSSWLGLYRSKNIFIKYLSVMVAFHWAYGWVEDCNRFDMMNIGLWLIIGMCLSKTFRKMSDQEFELWFKSIFSDEKITPYQQWALKKELALSSDSNDVDSERIKSY